MRLGSKVVSLGVAISFIFPYLTRAFNSPDYLNHSQYFTFARQTIEIPENIGYLTDGYAGRDRLVVCVQDLHCNYEVQTNIANLIKWLAKNHGLSLVAVEGASQAVNVSKLAAFPVPEVKEKTADYLLRQGKITGPEMAAATGKQAIRLEGIENPELYAANYSTVHKLLCDEAQGLIEDLRDAIRQVKSGVNNEALTALDSRQQAVREGKSSRLQYCAWLSGQAQRLNIDLSAFPLVRAYLSGQPGDSGSGTDELALDVEKLEHTLREGLTTSAAQAEVDTVADRVSLIEKLVNISAVPEELAEFRRNPGPFQVKALLEVLERYAESGSLEVDPEIYKLDEFAQQAWEFYQVADLRSRAFVENTLARMQAQNERLAVMVAGGYHLEDIKAGLKARGVSYVCVKPRLLRPDAVNPYLAVLQGKRTPLEKLLARNQNIFSPPTSFPEGAASTCRDPVFANLLRQIFGIGTLIAAWKTTAADRIGSYYESAMNPLVAEESGVGLKTATMVNGKLVAEFNNRITVVIQGLNERLNLKSRVAALELGNHSVEVMAATAQATAADLKTQMRQTGWQAAKAMTLLADWWADIRRFSLPAGNKGRDTREPIEWAVWVFAACGLGLLASRLLPAVSRAEYGPGPALQQLGLAAPAFAVLPVNYWLPLAGLAIFAGGLAMFYRHPEWIRQVVSRMLRRVLANNRFWAPLLLLLVAKSSPLSRTEQGVLRLLKPENGQALALAQAVLELKRPDVTFEDLRAMGGASGAIGELDKAGLLEKVKGEHGGRAKSGQRRINPEFWKWRAFLQVAPERKSRLAEMAPEALGKLVDGYPEQTLELLIQEARFLPVSAEKMEDAERERLALQFFTRAQESWPGWVADLPPEFPYAMIRYAQLGLAAGKTTAKVETVPAVKITDVPAASEKAASEVSEEAAATKDTERLQAFALRARKFQTLQILETKLEPMEWQSFLQASLVIIDGPGTDAEKIQAILEAVSQNQILNTAVMSMQLPQTATWPLLLLKANKGEAPLPVMAPEQPTAVSVGTIMAGLRRLREAGPFKSLAYRAYLAGVSDRVLADLLMRHSGRVEAVMATQEVMDAIAGYNSWSKKSDGRQLMHDYLSAALAQAGMPAEAEEQSAPTLRLPGLEAGAGQIVLTEADYFDLKAALESRQKALLGRGGADILKRLIALDALDSLVREAAAGNGSIETLLPKHQDTFTAAGFPLHTSAGRQAEYLFQAAVIDVRNNHWAAQVAAARQKPDIEAKAGSGDKDAGQPAPVSQDVPEPDAGITADELLAYRTFLHGLILSAVGLINMMNRMYASAQQSLEQAQQGQAAAESRTRAAEITASKLEAEIPKALEAGLLIGLRLVAAGAHGTAIQRLAEMYERDLVLMNALRAAGGIPEYAQAASENRISPADISAMLARRPKWQAEIRREALLTSAVKKSLELHEGYPKLAAAFLPAVTDFADRWQVVQKYEPAFAEALQQARKIADFRYRAVAQAMQANRFRAVAANAAAEGMDAAEFERRVRSWQVIDPGFRERMALTRQLDEHLKAWAEAACYQDRIMQAQVPANVLAAYLKAKGLEGGLLPADPAGSAKELMQIVNIDLPRVDPDFRQLAARERQRYFAVKEAVLAQAGNFAAARNALPGFEPNEALGYHQRLLRADAQYRQDVRQARQAEAGRQQTARSITRDMQEHKNVMEQFFGRVVMVPGITYEALTALTAGLTTATAQVLGVTAGDLEAARNAISPVAWERFRALFEDLRSGQSFCDWSLGDLLRNLTEAERAELHLLVYAYLVPAADRGLAMQRLGLEADPEKFGDMLLHGQECSLLEPGERQVVLTPNGRKLVEALAQGFFTAASPEPKFFLNWLPAMQARLSRNRGIPGINGMLEYIKRDEISQTRFRSRAEMEQDDARQPTDAGQRLSLPERIILEMFRGQSKHKYSLCDPTEKNLLLWLENTLGYAGVEPLRKEDIDFAGLRGLAGRERKFCNKILKLDAATASDDDFLAAFNALLNEAGLDKRLAVDLRQYPLVIRTLLDPRSKTRLGARELLARNYGLVQESVLGAYVKNRLGFPAVIGEEIILALMVPALKKIVDEKTPGPTGQNPFLHALKQIAYYLMQQNQKLQAAGFKGRELAILQRALMLTDADELISRVSQAADRPGEILEIYQQVLQRYAPENLDPVTRQALVEMAGKLKLVKGATLNRGAFRGTLRPKLKNMIGQIRDLGYSQVLADTLLQYWAQTNAILPLENQEQAELIKDMHWEYNGFLEWTVLQWKWVMRKKTDISKAAEFMEVYDKYVASKIGLPAFQHSDRPGFEKGRIASAILGVLSLAVYAVAQYSGAYADFLGWGPAVGAFLLGSYVIYASVKLVFIRRAFTAPGNLNRNFIEPLEVFQTFDPFAEAGSETKLLSVEQRGDIIRQGVLDRISPQGRAEISLRVGNLPAFLQYTVWAHVLLHERWGAPEKLAYALELPYAAILYVYVAWLKARGQVLSGQFLDRLQQLMNPCKCACPNARFASPGFLVAGFAGMINDGGMQTWPQTLSETIIPGLAGNIHFVLLAGIVPALFAGYFLLQKAGPNALTRQPLELVAEILESRLRPETGVFQAMTLPSELQDQAANQGLTATETMNQLGRLDKLLSGFKSNQPILRASAGWIHALRLDTVRLGLEGIISLALSPGLAKSTNIRFDYRPLILSRFLKVREDLQDPVLAAGIDVRTLDASVGLWNFLKGQVVGHYRQEADNHWVVFVPGRVQAALAAQETRQPVDRVRRAWAELWAAHILEYQGWRFRADLAGSMQGNIDQAWQQHTQTQLQLAALKADPAGFLSAQFKALAPELQTHPFAAVLANLAATDPLLSDWRTFAQTPNPQRQAQAYHSLVKRIIDLNMSRTDELSAMAAVSAMFSSMGFVPMLVLAQPQDSPAWQGVPAACRQPLLIPAALLRERGFKGFTGRLAVRIQGPYAVDMESFKGFWHRLRLLAVAGSA